MDGFLDNLPDLGMGGRRKRRKRKPAQKPEQKPAADPVVLYVRLKCPRCGSRKVPVYDSSHLPIRYHKCAECGLNFKSVEKQAR